MRRYSLVEYRAYAFGASDLGHYWQTTRVIAHHSHSAHPLTTHFVNNTPSFSTWTKQPPTALTFLACHVINNLYQVYNQIMKSFDRMSNGDALRTESRQLLRSLYGNTPRKRP